MVVSLQAIETFKECGKKDNKMAGMAATNLSFILFLVRSLSPYTFSITITLSLWLIVGV